MKLHELNALPEAKNKKRLGGTYRKVVSDKPVKEIYDKNILELCMKKQEEFDEKVY